MSAVAKTEAERVLRKVGRARARRAWNRPLLHGPATQFQRDPDRVDGVSGLNWPADDPLTPAVKLFIEGEPFEIDGDLYYVERVLASTLGPQADLLILRGHEYMRCAERSTRRAIQIRDLEELIDQDRVGIPFGPDARQFNLTQGWCRGGRILGSLGIHFGDDA